MQAGRARGGSGARWARVQVPVCPSNVDAFVGVGWVESAVSSSARRARLIWTSAQGTPRSHAHLRCGRAPATSQLGLSAAVSILPSLHRYCMCVREVDRLSKGRSVELLTCLAVWHFQYIGESPPRVNCSEIFVFFEAVSREISPEARKTLATPPPIGCTRTVLAGTSGLEPSGRNCRGSELLPVLSRSYRRALISHFAPRHAPFDPPQAAGTHETRPCFLAPNLASSTVTAHRPQCSQLPGRATQSPRLTPGTSAETDRGHSLCALHCSVLFAPKVSPFPFPDVAVWREG